MDKADIKENIIFSGFDLQPLLNCGTLESAEVAFNDIMTFKKKEKYVLERHSNKISKREDSRHSKDFYYTRIKTPAGSIKISGSYTDLIIKLYDFYVPSSDKGSLTFADIRPDFEKWFRKGRKPATLKISKSSYKHIKGSSLDKTPICKITYQSIKKFFNDFSAEHDGEYVRSLYEKLRTDIYNMLDYALDADIISNRVEMFSFPKSITVRFKQSEPSKTWTHSQHLALCDFLDSKTDDVFALLFKYQLLTGERFETASAIMPDDIDNENMLLFIHNHQITADDESGSHFMVIDGTKGNSSHGKREVPILPETLSILRHAFSLNPGGTYVFEFNGKPLNPDTYRKHVKKLCEAAGVPYYKPHSARNFVASSLFTGDNIKEMCDYFGWACSSMALHYSRNITDDDSAFRSSLAKMAHRKDSTP